jgi:hypothetical protein
MFQLCPCRFGTVLASRPVKAAHCLTSVQVIFSNFVFSAVCYCFIYEVVACFKRQICAPMYTLLEQYWQLTGSLQLLFSFYYPFHSFLRLFASSSVCWFLV